MFCNKRKSGAHCESHKSAKLSFHGCAFGFSLILNSVKTLKDLSEKILNMIKGGAYKVKLCQQICKAGIFAFAVILLNANSAFCESSINLSVLSRVESSENPNALGDYKNGHARSIGLYQISHGLLSDYNRAHRTEWYHIEMRSPDQSEAVANWAFTEFFPHQLKHMHKRVTRERLIVCWNAGCSALKESSIPLSTKKYLNQYKKYGGQL